MYNKLLITALMLFVSLKLLAVSRSEGEQLKDLTVKVFYEIKTYTSNVNIPLGQLVFTTTSQTHAVSSNTDISVSINEIASMVRGESALFKKLFIRFVLAHELAHRLQFTKYPKGIIENTKGEGRIFLECNADMLANFLCTGIINVVEIPMLRRNSSFDILSYNKNTYSTYTRVYQRVFQMDLVNQFATSHPTNLQRITAVKFGTLLGNCYNMQYVVVPKDGAELKQYLLNLETLKTIAKAIGFGPRDNPYIWAHSESVRIINENNTLAKNLIRFNVNIQKERTPGTSDRFYDYSFRVFNGNNVSVRFAGRVYSEVDFGNEADNLVKAVPIDASSFERVIPANSSITISGRIRYIIVDTLSSTLILPGDKKSLYFVFDATNPALDLSNVYNADNNFTEWRLGLEEEIYDHIFEIVQIRSQLSELKKGIGISEAANDEEMESENAKFEPSFKAGRHDDQVLIYFPRTQNIIYEFQATETNHLETANQRFELILNKIKKGVGSRFTFNEIQGSNPGKRVELRDSNSKRALLLRLVSNNSKAAFCVMVDIYGK